MRVGVFLPLVVLIAATSSTPAKQPELDARVVELVRKNFPEATVTQRDGKLVAKHGTMIFTIHQRWKSGEIRPETKKVEGPNYKGFILTLFVEDRQYEGQAAIPQTYREPYWHTFLDRPPTADGKGHYVINFSFGSRLDAKFKKALLELLPRSRGSRSPSTPPR